MNGIGKTRAFLTEFVIVILFFSLSVVIALQLFLKADEKSKDSKNETMAYIVAQQAAERIRSGLSDEEELSLGLFCEWYSRKWISCEKEDARFVLSIEAETENTQTGIITRAFVVVSDVEGSRICRLPVTVFHAGKGGSDYEG